MIYKYTDYDYLDITYYISNNRTPCNQNIRINVYRISINSLIRRYLYCSIYYLMPLTSPFVNFLREVGTSSYGNKCKKERKKGIVVLSIDCNSGKYSSCVGTYCIVRADSFGDVRNVSIRPWKVWCTSGIQSRISFNGENVENAYTSIKQGFVRRSIGTNLNNNIWYTIY